MRMPVAVKSVVRITVVGQLIDVVFKVNQGRRAVDTKRKLALKLSFA